MYQDYRLDREFTEGLTPEEMLDLTLFDTDLFDDEEGCIPKVDWWNEEILETFCNDIDGLYTALNIPILPQTTEGEQPTVIQVLGQVEITHDGCSEEPVFDIVFSEVTYKTMPHWHARRLLTWFSDIYDIYDEDRSLR